MTADVEQLCGGEERIDLTEVGLQILRFFLPDDQSHRRGLARSVHAVTVGFYHDHLPSSGSAVPIPKGKVGRPGAAPLRSWSLGRRSGRVATAPDPPPKPSSIVALRDGRGNDLAGRDQERKRCQEPKTALASTCPKSVPDTLSARIGLDSIQPRNLRLSLASSAGRDTLEVHWTAKEIAIYDDPFTPRRGKLAASGRP